MQHALTLHVTPKRLSLQERGHVLGELLSNRGSGVAMPANDNAARMSPSGRRSIAVFCTEFPNQRIRGGNVI